MLPGCRSSGLSGELVRQFLERPVGLGMRRVSDFVDGLPPLEPIEEEALGARAIQRRRTFFTLGRAAARDAMAELGFAAAAIGRGSGGEPLWPDGLVGAITHAGDLAIALVGRRSDYVGLGVDVEELSRGPSPRAARLICRPSEMEWVDPGGGTERLAMLFSAKEAIFKALYPIEQVWLGFGDAELSWRAERCAFEARILKSVGDGFAEGFVLEVHSVLTPTQVLSAAACYA